MFFIDYWYLILVVPAILLGAFAQAKVSGTLGKYDKMKNSKGLTGAEVARQILNQNGLHNVDIEQTKGNLTDHYDPTKNVIRLSGTVYNSTSVAAIGVAAHEVGHAIQYATGYAPVKIRSAIIPITNFGSQISPFLIILGFVFFEPFITIGIALFSLVALFQLITLPVEFNASNRAILTLSTNGILSTDELTGAKKVLSAAALTYVTALIMSIANLLRLILISGGRGRRR